MFALAPLLWGAGLGALGGLITGKDPLKGALVGGATGGLLGGIPAGSWTGGAAEATQGATGLIGAGSNAFGGAAGGAAGGSIGGATGSFAGGADPSAFLKPTVGQEIGGPNAWNFVTNEPLNVATNAVPATGSITGEIGGANLINSGLPPSVTSMQDFAGSQVYGANNAMLNEPMLGGVNTLSSSDYAKIASTPATPDQSMFDYLSEKVSPYLNVRDLTGAAQVASQYQPRPQPTPQSGRITEGKAPQGTDVMALLQSIKQPERRRITLL